VLAFVAAANAGERHRELAGPEPLPLDELHLHECRPIVHSNAFGLLCFDLLVTGRINDRAPARSYRRVSQRHMTCGRTWAPLAMITCTRFSLDSGCDSLTPEASNEVEHEDNVINQRLSWFVAAHTFLFSAYAILLNAPPHVRLQSFAAQREILFFLILLVAVGVSILIYITVIAATLATAKLRGLLKTHMNEKDSVLLPPVQGVQTNFTPRAASPILIPLLFMISWIVLLFKSL
jgi:hypothetical protein